MKELSRETTHGRSVPLRIVTASIVGLAVVLCLRAANAPRAAHAELSLGARAAGVTPTELATVQPSVPEQVAWPTSWSRDPFARTTGEPAAALPTPVVREPTPQMRLGGILYGTNPVVIINGVICREGDVIGDHRVQRIEREKVVLERQGVALVLTP